MNKAELIEEVVKNTQLSRNQIETVLDSTIAAIQANVAQGKDVKLVGFGTFDRSHRQARNGRNPKTGAQMIIPESIVPRFRPGKDFKSLVTEQKSPKA